MDQTVTDNEVEVSMQQQGALTFDEFIKHKRGTEIDKRKKHVV